ncbi:MAG: hypothetical protein AMJ37_01185 [Dehalococcoidia bacterium DG_18]|nr:MAG: hypothetical protein AMJ37_01185 [Dehalococcoidia bacterium DG_18]
MVGQPLTDVRVLDLTHHIAGPYCTKLLGDLGAEVIKIEKPGEGDTARRIGPFPNDEPHLEKSGLFLYLNTNKRGITLNLKSETGKKIFKELVKDADILVENFEPRVMPSLGLDSPSLGEINPKLVMTSISNFGQTGTYRDYKATEIVAYALGGLMYTCGNYDREPIKHGLSMGQMLTGANAAASTLVALYCQREEGIGQHVDVSVTESVTQLCYVHQLIYFYGGMASRRRIRVGGKYGAFGDVFPCKDGYFVPIMIALEWDLLVNFFNAPDTLGKPEFTSAASRITHADEVDNALEALTRDRSKHELFHSGQEWRLPWALVQDAKDLVNCPQLQARDFFVQIDHPMSGELIYPGTPYKMSEIPPPQMYPAPLLGEHNEEIYCKRLGYTKEDLVRLRDRGVI